MAHDISLSTGQMVLVVRAGKDATSTVLELWESSRVIAELQIPAKLHGSVFADGWFSNGAAWDPSESRVAYVAEVSAIPTVSRPESSDKLSMIDLDWILVCLFLNQQRIPAPLIWMSKLLGLDALGTGKPAGAGRC